MRRSSAHPLVACLPRATPGLVGLALVAALTACGDDGGGSGPEAAPDVFGLWSVQETLADAASGAQCQNASAFGLLQDGPNISGSYAESGACAGAGGAFRALVMADLEQGRVAGSTIRFRTAAGPPASCAFVGTLAGDPPAAPTVASGTVTCTGSAGHYGGTWQATRVAAAPELDAAACALEATTRSTEATSGTLVLLDNRSDRAVRLYWLDEAGARQDRGPLPPGEGVLYRTAVGHPFIVTDAGGECLALYHPAGLLAAVTIR